MKINGDLRKLYSFKHFGDVHVHPKRGCEGMQGRSQEMRNVEAKHIFSVKITCFS